MEYSRERNQTDRLPLHLLQFVVEITPTFYSTSFIAVLDRLLETEDLRPDRMVHGYLSTRC